MPWILSQREGKWCVVKKGETSPVPGGCHDSRAKAIKHQRALYANESRMASMEPLTQEQITAAIDGLATLAAQRLDTQAGFYRANAEWQPNLTAAVNFAPPKHFFETPEPDSPTPMTYEDDGRVYGHPALWGSCHRGFMGGAFEQCVTPPRSNTDYAQFHLGHIITKEGERVAIGKITFDTDHAPLTSDVQAASRHYDNTGSVGAYVRASNGKLGPWFSGVLKPDLAPEDLVSLRANPLSGDWRSLNGNLELVAALAVPVPGFPIPQLALSAALEGGVQSLILPGYCDCAGEEDEEAITAAYSVVQKGKKKVLTKRMMTAAVLTSEKRKSLPKTSFAIPSERRYPIHDMAHARNALARSSGKPEEATVRRAVCRRYPSLCS
ncbi:MAG TPA: hypothetical protein VLA89_00965 [Gemmatimonadales bacterium]|nr:hypothetical protein [Gemmatimonadales bacterium]